MQLIGPIFSSSNNYIHFVYQQTAKVETDTDSRGERIVLTNSKQFRRLYEKYYSQLKYFGMQYVSDEDIVSDVLQDLWLKLWERRETYTNETTFKVYLFRSFYNALMNYLKHQAVEQDFAAREMLTGEQLEESVGTRMIEAEVYQMVNDAFEELSDPCRRVYTASLEGKSQKEIAEQYDITVNTVKKHINNANHYLRKLL